MQKKMDVEDNLTVRTTKRTYDRLCDYKSAYFPIFHTKSECCVPECGDLLKPLCRLPNSKVQQRKWLRVIGNPILETEYFGIIHKHYRICRKHFTDEAFHKWRKFGRICYPFLMNIMPTLYLPVIKEDLFPHINLKSDDPTSLVQSEPPACYDPVTNESLQSSPTEFSEPFNTRDDTSAYHKKVKIEPSGEEQIYLKKEPLDIYMEVDINSLNETEILASSSNMEKWFEFSAEDKKLFKINEKFVRPYGFCEHLTTKLESYNQNTHMVVQKLIAEILLNADDGLYETALTPTI